MFFYYEVNMETQGISFCCFHVYMYYNPNWFISSSPLHSPPSPLPIVALASLRFLYSFLHSEHINHIQVFSFLPLPLPSHEGPPLNVTHVP
jgi:hypothetical protein